MVTRALAIALAAAALPPAAAAAHGRFAAHAELKPTGCTQTVAGTVLTLRGCAASAPFAGSTHGTLAIAYGAKVDVTKGAGVQTGKLTLRGATARDRLVLAFKGTVSVAGTSHGRWTALRRTGSFAKAAPRTGSYSSTTPDQGAHVSFDVRG